MKLALDPKIQKIIDEHVKAGRFASREDVIAAALLALEQQERFEGFDSQDLDALIAEGEQSIADGGLLNGEDAAAARRERRRQA